MKLYGKTILLAFASLGLVPSLLILLGSFFPCAILNVSDCRMIRAPSSLIASVEHPACACVIGSTAGIGRELALLLGNDRSVNLILTGRSISINASRTDGAGRVVQASRLDLEDERSIEEFVRELRTTLGVHCRGQLDYLFLNAAMIYSGDYSGPFTSRNGRYDRLFDVNFMGYVRLLHLLRKEDVDLTFTRVVFTSSVAHFIGSKHDILWPNLSNKTSSTDKLRAYSTTKLAFMALQQILTMKGITPNSVAVTCGAAITSIGLAEHERSRKSSVMDNLGWLEALRVSTTQFTSQQGAEVVLHAALLRSGEVKIGELVLPYSFGFGRIIDWMKRMHDLIPPEIPAWFTIGYEHGFQKMTYKKNHVWVCPAAQELRDQEFLQMFRSEYLDLLIG